MCLKGSDCLLMLSLLVCWTRDYVVTYAEPAGKHWYGNCEWLTDAAAAAAFYEQVGCFHIPFINQHLNGKCVLHTRSVFTAAAALTELSFQPNLSSVLFGSFPCPRSHLLSRSLGERGPTCDLSTHHYHSSSRRRRGKREQTESASCDPLHPSLLVSSL